MEESFYKLKGKDIWYDENCLVSDCRELYKKTKREMYWEDGIRMPNLFGNIFFSDKIKLPYPYSGKSYREYNIIDYILYPSADQSYLIKKTIYNNACKTVCAAYKALSKYTSLTLEQDTNMKKAYNQLKHPYIFSETYNYTVPDIFYAEKEALDIINNKDSEFKKEFENNLCNLEDLDIDLSFLNYNEVLTEYDQKYKEEFNKDGVFINIENLHFTNDGWVSINNFGKMYSIAYLEDFNHAFGDDKEKGEYTSILRLADYESLDTIFHLKIARIK